MKKKEKGRVIKENWDEVSIVKKQKHLKVDRILLVIFCLLSIIAIIVMIDNIIKELRIKDAEKKEISQLEQLEAKKEAEEKRLEEVQRQKELEEQEKISKRYNPLNEEEFDKMNKIYGHSDKKRIFLTFDDGPTKSVTPYILNLLKEENVKANFFVLGMRVEQNPDLVKREFDEGHFIGNHSYSHKYSKIYESIDSLFDEYNRTNNAIKSAVQNDKYNSIVFRFPGGLAGGKYNDMKHEAAQKLKEQGIANVDWNALTKDAEGAKTKEDLMNNFIETIQNKTSIVLLMHDAADKILTYEVLPDIIKYCKENGYEFQTMFDAIGRE